MAKNNEKLDDLNLDDFDLDFNIIDNPSIKRNDRNPLLSVATNASKGFRSTVANKSFIERVLRKVLPRGFSDAYDQVKTITGRGRQLYNGAAADIRPAYADLSRAINSVTPIVRTKGHNTLADKLDKLFKPAPGKPQQSFDPDQSGIDTQLAEIFKLQAQDEEKKDQRNRAVDQLKDRTATRRHADLMGQQTLVADGINQLVGYQNQVTSRYQQKMLELNFRQYYALRDMLGTLQGYVKDTHTQLDTVIHNTALPDILKMQASEQFVNQARQRMFGKVQERAGDYFRNYTNKVFDNIEKEVKGFTNNLSMGMQMGSQLLDAQRMQMEYSDGSEGEGAGGLAGRGLGYLLGEKVGKFGRKYLSKNKRINDTGSMLGYYANNIPEALNQLRQNRQFYGDWRDHGMNAARRILPGPFQRNKQLEGGDELFGGMPTTFDNQTHKSINVIMPGLLSRILRSLEYSRTGKDPGLTVFNGERNAFGFQKERVADIAEAVLSTKQVKGLQDTAANIVDRFDPDKKLSPEARKALGETLINQADTGESFSPSRLAMGHVNFGNDPRVHSELSDFFRGRYNVDAYGKTGKDAETFNRMSADSSSFRYLRDAMPDVYATINRMVATGNAEDLRALGILVPDPANPRKEIIDYSFIQNRTSGKDWNIGDLGGGGGKNDRRRKRGRGGRGGGGGGGGGGDPVPPVPPTPTPPAFSSEELLKGMTAGFDRLITAVNDSIGALGKTIIEESEKQRKATEEFSAKPEAVTAVGHLEAIVKMLKIIMRRRFNDGRGGNGGGGNGSADGEDGSADGGDPEDPDTSGGDFFDRARRGFRWGRRKGGEGYRWGKGFAQRQYGRARNLGGRAFGAAKRGVGKARDWALSGVSVLKTAMDFGGVLLNSMQEVFDIYTSPNAAEPVMTAIKMRNGQYFDFYSRDPILKFSDIRGPVVDAEGNVVLTEDDIRNGLYGKNGKPVGGNLMRGAIKGVMKLGGAILGMPKAYINLVVKTAKKAVSIAHNLIDGPADVYVRGEESPRLLAIIMKRKGYLSKATRKIIERPSDIDGEVLDLQGNTVLAITDIQQGLVDVQGRPITGVGGKLLRLAKSAMGLGGKALGLLNRARKYAWDKAKAGARVVGRGVRAVGRGARGLWRGITKGINFHADIGFGVGIGTGGGIKPVVDGLEAIYNLLDDRLPGQSKFRTGSWQERYKSKSPKETIRRIERAAEGNPTLKYLMMFGGAVMSGFAWLKSKMGSFFDVIKGALKLKGAASVGGDLADAASDAAGGRGRRGRGGWLRRAARGVGKLAKGAGRLALAAAPLIGEGAMAVASTAGTVLAGVGTAIASVITAPVAIAVGVAVAGYFVYRYFKGRPQPLQRLRLAEYGFDPSDKDALKKVIEMEGYLLPNVSVSGQSASFQKVNMEELMSRLEIPNDPPQQQAFVTWFASRFRPVFLRNVAQLKKISSGVSLLEVDDKLDKSLMVDFAVASKTPPSDASQPYIIGGKPFGDIDPLTTGTKTIDEEISAIRKEFGEYKKKENAKESGTTGSTTAAAGTGMLTGIGAMAVKENHPTGAFQASTQTYVTPSEKSAAGGYEPGITASQWSPGSNRLLDDLTAIRMRLYGLTSLDISQVNALTTLESNIQDYVTIAADGKVTMSRSAEAIFQENAGLFGRNPSDLAGQKQWVEWFNYRFLPVYVQFVNCVWGINRNIKVGLAWKYLRPEDMLSVAEILKGVKANTPDGAISVWAVKASPFVGGVSNSDITTIDANLTSLRNQIKNNQYKEKTPNAAVNSGTQGAGTATANAAVSGNSQSGGGMWQSIKNWFSGDNKSGAASPAMGGATAGQSGSYNPAWGGGGGGGPVAAMGTPIQQPGNGTGGDINQIPSPEGDGSWDALKKTIVAAAVMAGVDPGLMASMAFVESGFRAAVKPGTSAAQGLYQFIPSTWKVMLKKYASKYGIDPNTPPSDPRANALMGAEYLKENQQILENKLGRPVTGTDLYLSHFLGGAGGPRLLKAPSGDPATNHVDASAASANKSIFYAGGRPRTVAEVIAWANKRIENDGGKFMQEANALAGRPAALKAANDPNKNGPSAANDGDGAKTASADGSAAYAATQKQAAELNAAGVPAPTAAPAPTGGGSGTSGSAPSTSASTTSTAPSEQETSQYVTETRATAKSSKAQEQVESANGMINATLEKQLTVQEEMSASLKSILSLLGDKGTKSGSGNQSSAPSNTTVQKNGNDQRGTERVQPPISMKRKVG